MKKAFSVLSIIFAVILFLTGLFIETGDFNEPTTTADFVVIFLFTSISLPLISVMCALSSGIRCFFEKTSFKNKIEVFRKSLGSELWIAKRVTYIFSAFCFGVIFRILILRNGEFLNVLSLVACALGLLVGITFISVMVGKSKTQ